MEEALSHASVPCRVDHVDRNGVAACELNAEVRDGRPLAQIRD
jgi:hypothetical protein